MSIFFMFLLAVVYAIIGVIVVSVSYIFVPDESGGDGADLDECALVIGTIFWPLVLVVVMIWAVILASAGSVQGYVKLINKIKNDRVKKQKKSEKGEIET